MAGDSDWSARDATDKIRAIARSPRLSISYKIHARERLTERNLIVSDVLYVLKNGFVHLERQPSTQRGYYRYCMDCRSPNSGGRVVRVVVIPDMRACQLKIVTVMWVDELATRDGTIIGEYEND